MKRGLQEGGMTFTVTYRGADGALHEEAVEAAGRAECFAQMKARGIVPVSVKEGASLGERASRPFRSRAKTGPRNAQDARCPSGGGKPQSSIFNLKSSIILAAVLAAAGGAWWWLSAREDERPPEPKAVKEAKAVKEKSKDVVVAKEIKDVKDVKDANPPNDVPAAKPLPSAGATAETPHGRQATNRVIVVENDATDPNHKSDFSTGVEQVMGWIFTTELGDSPPPLPDLSASERKRIVEILLAKNPVEEEDSEKTAEAKEMVSAAKKELMKYLKQGGDMDDFLTFYRNELVKAQEQREDAKRLVRDVAREGDDEMTVQFPKEVNGKLAERGIKAVELPAKVRRRLEAAGADVSNKQENRQ